MCRNIRHAGVAGANIPRTDARRAPCHDLRCQKPPNRYPASRQSPRKNSAIRLPLLFLTVWVRRARFNHVRGSILWNCKHCNRNAWPAAAAACANAPQRRLWPGCRTRRGHARRRGPRCQRGRAGSSFVGKSGQLLDHYLEAVDLSRDKTSILPISSNAARRRTATRCRKNPPRACLGCASNFS